MPSVHVRHAHSPSRNMQHFESQAGTKKASHFCEAFFVNLLVQNSNLLLEDLKRLNQLKDTQIQAGLDTKKDTLIKKTGVQRKI